MVRLHRISNPMGIPAAYLICAKRSLILWLLGCCDSEGRFRYGQRERAVAHPLAVAALEPGKNTVQGSESQSEMDRSWFDPLPAPMLRSQENSVPPILSNR